MSGNQKPEGYDAAMYYTPEADFQNTQLIVSQVGEATNWKMCVDTSVNNNAEAKVNIKHTERAQVLLRHFFPVSLWKY